MDKREFLKELGKYLEILDEKEQQDILDEYLQHIEMKMKDGMSEQEAIKDFGDIHELAADILEAYHVKPQYDGKNRQNLIKVKEEGKKVCHSAVEIVGDSCRDGAKALKRLWNGICNILKKPFRLAGKLEGKMSEGFSSLHSGKKESKKNKEENGEKTGFMMGVWNGFKREIGWCVSAFRWCMRCLWNLFMAGIALFSGICMMFGILFFGIVIVLLIAGYPLLGVMIMTFGIILATGALVVLSYCSMRRGSKKREEEC